MTDRIHEMLAACALSARYVSEEAAFAAFLEWVSQGRPLEQSDLKWSRDFFRQSSHRVIMLLRETEIELLSARLRDSFSPEK